MIQRIGITCKLFQLKYISDRVIFDEMTRIIDPGACTCSFCGSSGHFRMIAPYPRLLITVRSGKREELPVSVPRAKCDICGRTISFQPDISIPYSSYSLRFILTVLSCYLQHSCPVRALCESWQISVPTLYTWIHLFNEQYSSWCNVIDRVVQLSRDMLSKVSSTPGFLCLYQTAAGLPFMQSCKVVSSVTYIPPDPQAAFPTLPP